MGSVCFHWMPVLFHWVSNRFLVHKRSVHRLATRRLLSNRLLLWNNRRCGGTCSSWTRAGSITGGHRYR
jgi:hypothetical protein